MTNMKATLLARTALTMALGAAVVLPAGCGVLYQSPSVSRAAGADVDVRVIDLDSETVLVANRTPYSPRNLPREFYASAAMGQQLGPGALPAAPVLPDERPAQMELRLPPEVSARPYRIGVGDVVLLATKTNGNSVEQLSGLLAAQTRRQGYTVSDDGTISIPDVGRVEIGGLTLQEAQDTIFRFLLENQVDPAFSLEVAEFNSQRVTVGGAVQQAARVPLALNPLSLREALTAAGGATIRDEQFASIRIYRGGTLYQIPYETYIARPDVQNLTLVNGDAVFVDTSYDLDRALEFYRQEIDVIRLRAQARKDTLDMLQTEIELRRGMLAERRENFTARTEFDAEERDYVYLTGEVKKQSRFTLPYGRQATLADVLYDSGGFPTQTGNPRNIYVLRPSADPAEFGAVTAWHLNAANAANISLATRMQMRPNDIVFIEEQPITKWGRAFNQLLPQLVSIAGQAAVNN